MGTENEKLLSISIALTSVSPNVPESVNTASNNAFPIISLPHVAEISSMCSSNREGMKMNSKER